MSRYFSGAWRAAQAIGSRPGALVLGATVVGAGAWAAVSLGGSPHARGSMQRQGVVAAARGQALRPGTSRGVSTAPPAGPADGPAPSGADLVFRAATAMIPHPSKAERGGEDAWFVAETGTCVGVADGVGGWAEVGVDPGLYSRELMAHAREEAVLLDATGGEEDVGAVGRPKGAVPAWLAPQAVLQRAHARTRARGSCTACVLCLSGSMLYGANLGDSGFFVLRGQRLEFLSPQQQHEFNFPYQLGSPDSLSDSPADAQAFSIALRDGDVVVAATDGMFDNVYPDEAAKVIAEAAAAARSRWQAPKAKQRSAPAPAPAAAAASAAASSDPRATRPAPGAMASSLTFGDASQSRALEPDADADCAAAVAAARALAERAFERAVDPSHLSPFAYGAQQLGYRYFGGKVDDITVLVAVVRTAAGSDDQAAEPTAKL